MASEYKYDEESETWPYFVLALLIFALVPLTWKWLVGAFTPEVSGGSKDAAGAIKVTHETLELPHAKTINEIQSRRKSQRIFNGTFACVVVGWVLVVYIWRIYAKEVSLTSFFDPHTILDVPYTATEKEIKSKYRKLSLKFHPDKIAKDLSEAGKKEMEAAFIRINLAYKALTDAATKENLRLYGHPDGPQEISHGIAIPKFMVEGKYSPVMLVVYFILIGVLLPYIVGNWWNNVKSYTKKGLHVETANIFVRNLADKNPGKVFTAFDILDWVLQSQELVSAFPHLDLAEKKALVTLYLNRDFGDNDLVKLQIVSQLPKLIQGFIDIATVFRSHDVITAAFELEKAILQAVVPTGKHKELLQLPHVDRAVVESQDVKKLGKLVTLSKEDAGKVLGIKDSSKLDAALSVARSIPFIRVIDAYFAVPGEDIVPPNSSSHLVVKFLIRSPAFKSCPEIESDRLAEEETLEDLKNPLRSNDDGPQLPLAYAPYFPRLFQSSWEGFVINQIDNKLLENMDPAPLERVDLSNLKLTQQEWLKGDEGTVVISTFKIKMTVPAPPNIGTYHFRLLLKSNAYFGVDVDIPVEMVVKSPQINVEAVKKAVSNVSDSDSDSDSDISDPEEDTIAGALAALRGEKVKKVTGDDEESDAESVFTDINTDTEDEGEN